MSDRRDFLKTVSGFAALCVLPSPNLSFGKLAAISDPPCESELLEALRRLAFPSLQYDLPSAWIEDQPQISDARRCTVFMRGRSGVLVRKSCLVGSCVQTVLGPSRWKSEMAYQIAKRGKEAARDIAHLEGIDWRSNESKPRSYECLS